MADFLTFAAAEARAVAKVKDGTWVNAYAARQTVGGKFCVVVQRPMSPSAPDNGGWAEITDDGTT